MLRWCRLMWGDKLDGSIGGEVGDASLVLTDVADKLDGSTGGDEGNSTLMPSLAPPQATIDTKAKVTSIWETDSSLPDFPRLLPAVVLKPLRHEVDRCAVGAGD